MTPKTSAAPNAIELLEKDHALVKDLLEQLERTTARGVRKRTELFAQIAAEIDVHARIEEEIFYPAYHAAAKTHEDSKIFFEAAEEHGLVKEVIAAMEGEDPSSDVFAAKAKVLKDLVLHHAEEEEEEMFPRAKKLLGKPALAELGESLDARKQELAGGGRGRATNGRSAGTRTTRSNGRAAATKD